MDANLTSVTAVAEKSPAAWQASTMEAATRSQPEARAAESMGTLYMNPTTSMTSHVPLEAATGRLKTPPRASTSAARAEELAGAAAS